MLNIDIAIKFGSNEIIIYRKGFGILAKEPAFLAVVERGKHISVKAVGIEAEKLFLSKSSNVTVYQPIVNSEIVNSKMAILLLKTIIKKVITDKNVLSKVRALVAVPCALGEEKLLRIKSVLIDSGVSKVSFVQNAVCARNTLELNSHEHIMIVDIGKYLTDISILNDIDFVFGRLYYLGGDNMDKSITTYIADNHELEVSDLSSENIKNEIASLYDRDMYRTDYIGIAKNDEFVKHEIYANEVRVAIQNVYDKIFKFVREIYDAQTKEVKADIAKNGIMFVGGSSTIDGLYEYAKSKLKLPIIIPEDPANAVIFGAGKLLSQKDYLKIDL